MTTIADQGRLVADGFKIDLLPRPTHLDKLLLIGQDRTQGLGNLVDVQEPDFGREERYVNRTADMGKDV